MCINKCQLIIDLLGVPLPSAYVLYYTVSCSRFSYLSNFFRLRFYLPNMLDNLALKLQYRISVRLIILWCLIACQHSFMYMCI